jgi:hypothetical protein
MINDIGHELPLEWIEQSRVANCDCWDAARNTWSREMSVPDLNPESPSLLRIEFRNGLPVVIASSTTPAIDPAAVRRLLQEEGVGEQIALCSDSSSD